MASTQATFLASEAKSGRSSGVYKACIAATSTTVASPMCSPKSANFFRGGPGKVVAGIPPGSTPTAPSVFKCKPASYCPAGMGIGHASLYARAATMGIVMGPPMST